MHRFQNKQHGTTLLVVWLNIFAHSFAVPVCFPCRRRAARNSGSGVSSSQPRARLEYVAKMGGVDVADQRLGAHSHDHKPMTFFWRRVFDQKLAQAISNAYLIFAAWAGILAAQCEAALAALVVADGGEGVGGAAAGGGEVTDESESDLSREELEEFSKLLKKCLAMERVTWDQRLSTHLMALCNVGHVDAGGRRTAEVVQSYNSKGAKSARLCTGGLCFKPQQSRVRYSAARTKGVCWCNVCSGKKGRSRALHLCKTCHGVPTAHIAAAAAADGKKYNAVQWASA